MHKWFLGACLVVPAVYAYADSKARQAQKLYEDAEAFYKLQKYAKALEKYEKAYLLSKEPALLFNIGQCYRLMGKPAEAKRSYQTYLQEVPDSPDKEIITGLIRQMESLSASGISEDKLQQAARLFDEAEAFYKVQQFEQAAKKYEESYLLSNESVLLFNMAQCYRQMGKYDEAIKGYRTYLRENPFADKVKTEQLIAETEKLQTEATSTSAPTTQIVEIREVQKPFRVSYAMYGGAAAFGITSGVTGLIARGKVEQAKERSVVTQTSEASGVEADNIQKLLRSSRRVALLSDLSLGLAVGSAVSGLFLSRRESKIALSALPGQASLQVNFTW
jgi:tetratricopeptide (TPR) repeat protein